MTWEAAPGRERTQPHDTRRKGHVMCSSKDRRVGIRAAARRWLGRPLLALALLWPAAAPRAASGPWASGETMRARLIAAVDAAGADKEIRGGLQVSMAEGWDTYWRSPGDAGAAPTVDWSAMTQGALWSVGYAVLLVGVAVWRFLRRDVTS